MTWPTPRKLNLGITGDLLLTVLVVVAFSSLFALPPGLLGLGDYVLLAGASLAYLLLGIYGWKYWERIRSPSVALAYFTLQILLAAFLYYWSYGNTWLLLLPLASHSIELPRRWTLVVSLLLVGVIALPGLFPERILAAGLARPEDLAPTALLTTILDFGMALVFVLLFSEVLVRERQTRAELDEAHRRLSEYAVQVEDLATVHERNRLAREIHDSLGHHLTVINVQLEAARTLLDSRSALADDGAFASLVTCLDKAQALTRAGLTEVRRSVAALRASPLEGRSLPEALASVVEECRRAGIPTELIVTGEPRPLPPSVKQALFRAAQEGLTNVRKHAQASQAEVRLDYGDEAMVHLTVQDNGRGADMVRIDGRFGLLGVRERVRLLDGRVQVHTAPQEGFTLDVEVPG